MYRTTVEDIYEKYASLSIYSQAYSDDSSTAGEDDEISRSLKMFAMLSAYKPEPPLQSTNSVDVIMQEFACNGYSSDDQKYYPKNMNKTSGISTRGGNLWKYLPSSSGDYYYRKPPMKRYNNNVKNDKHSPVKHCVFCENNNEPEAVVKSHAVRDVLGRVLCPKLRTYVCPICKASGDMAHTVKYCPQKPIITMEEAMKAESYRFSKSTFFKQQMKT